MTKTLDREVFVGNIKILSALIALCPSLSGNSGDRVTKKELDAEKVLSEVEKLAEGGYVDISKIDNNAGKPPIVTYGYTPKGIKLLHEVCEDAQKRIEVYKDK